MAQFPCSMHRERYKGAQQTVYPALVKGTTRVGEKMRLCPMCFTTVLDWLQEHTQSADSQLGSFVCWNCAAPDPEWAIFVTVYALGADRQDFFGRSCGPCSAKASVALTGVGETQEPI